MTSNEPVIPDPDDPIFTAEPPAVEVEVVEASKTEDYLLAETFPGEPDKDGQS